MNFNMTDTKKTIYPAKIFFTLDNKFRRWIQNPKKILGKYINEGMTALDIGCGPGFFSLDMARMVGKSGRVIACDVQEGMLEKMKEKIHATEFEQRITLHRCQYEKINIVENVDFVLAFYVAHEIINQEQFFGEIGTILNQDGKFLVVEPTFHVSMDDFEETIRIARKVGFIPTGMPKILFSNAVILGMG